MLKITRQDDVAIGHVHLWFTKYISFLIRCHMIPILAQNAAFLGAAIGGFAFILYQELLFGRLSWIRVLP